MYSIIEKDAAVSLSFTDAALDTYAGSRRSIA